MTRLGGGKRPFYKRYFGFIIGLAVFVPGGIGILYLVTDLTDEEEFFFEEYSCLQLYQLNATANHYGFVTEQQKDRLYYLLEEKDCENWTLLD